MTSEVIRQKFRDFFERKEQKYKHVWVKSSSLVTDDPSVLLTTAGMQQFKKYYIVGEADPVSDFDSYNVISTQKCFRTSDIDEVGDESHLTFFEMLGNFSFDGYFKNDAIRLAVQFLRDEMEISFDRMSATYFGGDKQLHVLPDKISYRELKNYFEENKINVQGRNDNFWGPTGNEGPCGPTVELYVDGIEIWNLVFNQYYCSVDKKLKPLDIQGVDTGMGLERLTTVVQGKKNIFETDLLEDLVEIVPLGLDDRKKRISADHSRAIMFLIADGVRPGNKEAGYILRRLLRRLIFLEKEGVDAEKMFYWVEEKYKKFYPELDSQKTKEVFKDEYSKFNEALQKGSEELDKMDFVDAKRAFTLFETFGIPFELIKELAGEKATNLTREDFMIEFKKHQEISRAGAEKKFGGHGMLLNTGELKAKDEEELKKVTRLHTATHLLQSALRKVLGEEVKQEGSDITAERTRFDFSFSRKPTEEELKKVEDLVNDAILKNLPVDFKEMPIDEAKKTGALFFFKEKYPERIKVYYAGESLDSAFSKEFCGGPHVKNTSEIGHFKIIKSESIGTSTQRVRAVIE